MYDGIDQLKLNTLHYGIKLQRLRCDVFAIDYSFIWTSSIRLQYGFSLKWGVAKLFPRQYYICNPRTAPTCSVIPSYVTAYFLYTINQDNISFSPGKYRKKERQ